MSLVTFFVHPPFNDFRYKAPFVIASFTLARTSSIFALPGQVFFIDTYQSSSFPTNLLAERQIR